MSSFKKTQKSFGVWILALIVVVGLSACQSNSASNIEVQSQPSADNPATTTLPEPTVLVVSEDEQEETKSNECLVCHSDQQTLIDTASPVEVIESESSGEG